MMHSISFQTFFVQEFEIVVDSWIFTMLLLYILWGNWQIFIPLDIEHRLLFETSMSGELPEACPFLKHCEISSSTSSSSSNPPDCIDSLESLSPSVPIVHRSWYIYKTAFRDECLNIRGAFNRFPDFFVQAFKIVVDSWKFSMLLLYILWDDWPIFMISGSNEQL